MKSILFIDGENFRKSIKGVLKAHGKFHPVFHAFDFKGLLESALKGIQMDEVIFYFARLRQNPESEAKSKELIEERRLLKTELEKSGYKVILGGNVRAHNETVWVQNRAATVLVFKEKGVDVKIAVDMVSRACDSAIIQAIIGSSDSDLQPAIQELKNRKVKCIYLGFENSPNKGLIATTSKAILIRDAEVLEFQTKKGNLGI